jgi:hypothetical protein
MSGLITLAEQLDRSLRAIGWTFDDEDERRDRSKGGGSARPDPSSGGRGVRSSNPSMRPAPLVHPGMSSGAAGSHKPQAAVIKIASFAAGPRRIGALTDYLSRDGALAVETESGSALLGQQAINAEMAGWAPLFADLAPSKDVASLTLHGLEGSKAEITQALSQAVEGRRFAWQRKVNGEMPDDVVIRMIVVLAAKDRRRLDLSSAGRKALALRLSEVAGATVTVDQVSTGHGKDGLGYRLSRLVGRGPIELSDGRSLTTREEAGALTREWAPALNSRRIRDTMHLIVSAKAGTDADAFRATARDFLGETFAGHRYLFAIHRDRDHLHAHAVVTMRNTFGDKLDPKITDFSRWREAYAEMAHAHGIDMVATRRLERAAAPPYRLKDLNLIAAAERLGEQAPPHVRQRVTAKQTDAIHVPTRAEGRQAVARARLTAVATDDLDRLAIADIAANFLADLTTLWSRPREKETKAMAPRPLEDLQSDLQAMNATATRIALLLPAASRSQFHALAGPILQSAAAVVDEVAAASRVNAVVDTVRTAARQEEREARDAERAAHLARRAADPSRRDDPPGSSDRLASEDIARRAEDQARRERTDARQAADVLRQAETLEETKPASRLSSRQGSRAEAQKDLKSRESVAQQRNQERGIEDEL